MNPDGSLEYSNFSSRLRACFRDISVLPDSHPRRIGWHLTRIGMIAALPCMCLGVATVNISLGIAGVGMVLMRPPILAIPGVWLGLLFSVWLSMSAFHGSLLTHEPTVAGFGLIYTWLAYVTATVAYAHAQTVRLAIFGLVIIVPITAVLSITQFYYGVGGGGVLHLDHHGLRGKYSVGFSGLHLTQGYVMSLMILLTLTIRTSLPWLLRLVVMINAVIALMFSQARLAYLGIASGVGLALASRGFRQLLLGVGAAALCLALSIATMLIYRPGQFHSMIKGEDGRWSIWITSLHMIGDYPMLGVGGTEAFKQQYAHQYEVAVGDGQSEFPNGAPHAHNSFLSIAAMHGIPALFLYLSLWYVIARAAFQARRSSPQSWALISGVMGATLVAGQFEDLAGHSIPSCTFFTMLGLGLGLQCHESDTKTCDHAL